MKRKDLAAMGLSKEHVNVVMKMNGRDIEHAKSLSIAEVTRLKSENSILVKQLKNKELEMKALSDSVAKNIKAKNIKATKAFLELVEVFL